MPVRTRCPVLTMQLQRPLVKSLGRDASALELEQEPQSGSQQLVQVLDSERRERVRIERGGGAAAQAREELLLEQALPGFIEHPQLARGADEVGELVEQPGARTVERADPGSVQHLRTQLRTPRPKLPGDPLTELLGGAVIERDREDPIWAASLLDQPAEALGRRESLAGARSRGDEKRASRPCVRGGRLLRAEGTCAREADCAHSGGAPPYGHTAECGQLPKRVTHVPASSRGAGSK